jgi:hypothetical protein
VAAEWCGGDAAVGARGSGVEAALVIEREPFGRPGVIAAARTANALFFLAVSAYGLLSYSPFAYRQFIEPRVAPALNDFVAVSPWLFLATFLLTLLTLVPLIRRGAATRLAVSYLLVWGAIGVAAAVTRPLDTIGNSWRALAVGMLALASPVWLALLDHATWPQPEIRRMEPGRAFTACLWSGVAVWAVYAAAAPFRFDRAAGLSVAPGMFAAAVGVALVFGVFVFLAVFLAIASAGTVAAFARRPGELAYWLVVALLALGTALVMDALVSASIAFVGWVPALASAALGLTVAAVWSDLARLRVQPRSPDTLDALDLFCAPIAGRNARGAAALVLIPMPLVAYLLAEAVSRFDWNFLLQKLGVLLVALATFSAVCAATSNRARRAPWLVVAVPLLVFCLFHAAIEAAPATLLDRYATVDPWFRLIRDARIGRSVETVEYYEYLDTNTLISAPRIAPVEVDFVKPLHAAPGRAPHIFLFIVDSLRRDYLSPYNDRVTFTPEIAKLAADGFVFERAFTRYAGTMLALPSIWAGGMVPHTLEQPFFDQRNTLLKLLEANGYLRAMTRDDSVAGVMSGPDVVEFGKGRRVMDIDVCTTVSELETFLAARGAGRPIFFHSLPQDVHIGVASRRKVQPDESYPGFFSPVASAVREIDACLGGFVAFLKRSGWYDDSIVILTSDHGDSLGEEGRWGHAYFVVPEVMRIPLIVHLPARMRSRVSAELGAAAFSTDLAPSLYALLGYDPVDLGPLFGRPLFVAPDADVEWRRRQRALVASSYGAVYGTVHDNGRRLSVVDAVDGREHAFDMSRWPEQRLDVTRAMADENRLAVQRQLDMLASRFGYRGR